MSRYVLLEAVEAFAPGSGRSDFALAATIGTFSLFASPDLCWLKGSRSLLIGRLFDRAGRPVGDAARLDEALSRGFDGLLKDYWGRYVAIVDEAGEVAVLRDPSGDIPAYAVDARAGTALVSDAETAASFQLLGAPIIDHVFVRHWLQFPFLRSPRTGLANVEELVPGAARLLKPGARSRQHWLPARFASRSLPDFEEAARELRDVALSSVPLMIEEGPALLQLSGGLDSSIVAACLVSGGRPFEAATFATRSADGDEQRYAKSVAEHLGIELQVIEEAALDDRSTIFLTFRPSSNLLLEGMEHGIETCRQAVGARLVIDGGGGDSLFGVSRTAAALLDALRLGGIRQSLHDVSLRSSAGKWQVLGTALRQAFRHRPMWEEDPRFLKADTRLETADGHPWLDELSGLLLGAREHIDSLVHILHFLDRHQIGGEARHPLMNQRLLEYCLSMPSPAWSAGGRDRALARHAFAPLLPRAVTERQTKGSLQGFFHRRWREHAATLRSLLLDGELVRAGIVDAVLVEQALGASDRDDGRVMMRLSEIATLERWLGAWRALGGR